MKGSSWKQAVCTLDTAYVRFFFPCLIVLTSVATAQIQTDATIQMSDGVELEATITHPVDFPPSGGFPGIVLVHGFGGSKNSMNTIALFVATQGYASIAYSVRGQGNSGGLSTVDAERERQDLLEVIQYFREQFMINPNRLAVAGGSQGGIHAWMAAVYRMPGVKAVAALVATPDFARALTPNGCVKYGLPLELTLETVRYSPDRDRMREFIITDTYDSVLKYIDQRDLAAFVDSVQIPVFQGLGWADFLFPVNGGIHARDRLAARRIPIWSYFGTNSHGEPENAAEAQYVLNRIVDWFDRWLKDSSLEQDSVPLVFYSDDRPTWPRHTVTTWPPENSETLRLYFTQNGLQELPPTVSVALPFFLTYDSTYTPAMGWEDLYGGTAFANAFQSIGSRLVSEIFANDLEVTGIPTGKIFVQSDAGKFQAHLRFYDVTTSDTGDVWRLMSRSIHGIRGNTPEQVHEISIEATALSHIVPAGHRIGVEVTSLDTLAFEQANTIPFFASSESILLSTPPNPSYIEIPVVGSPVVAVEDYQPDNQPLTQLRNYPNPFNPKTIIEFSISRRQPVELKVFDTLGREVATLIDDVLDGGNYRSTFNGSALTNGVYFCRLRAGSALHTHKLLLLK